MGDWVSLVLGSVVVGALVAACSSGGGASKESEPVVGVVVPDAQAIQQLEHAASADDLRFQTAETIDGLSYGLLGDGVTDNTAAFQRALAQGNRTIHVPAGDYVSGKFT